MRLNIVRISDGSHWDWDITSYWVVHFLNSNYLELESETCSILIVTTKQLSVHFNVQPRISGRISTNAVLATGQFTVILFSEFVWKY